MAGLSDPFGYDVGPTADTHGTGDFPEFPWPDMSRLASGDREALRRNLAAHPDDDVTDALRADLARHPMHLDRKGYPVADPTIPLQRAHERERNEEFEEYPGWFDKHLLGPAFKQASGFIMPIDRYVPGYDVGKGGRESSNVEEHQYDPDLLSKWDKISTWLKFLWDEYKELDYLPTQADLHSDKQKALSGQMRFQDVAPPTPPAMLPKKWPYHPLEMQTPVGEPHGPLDVLSKYYGMPHGQ